MVQRVVQVAPVGDNPDALFIGVREFPTRKIVLMAPPEKMTEARKLEERLLPFKLPVTIYELKGDILEKMFEILASLKLTEGEDSIIVNVATGDRMTTCAALSASYVNGVKAFNVMGDQVLILPLLKFSFTKLISEKKFEIVRALSDGSPKSFEELGKKVRISAPLLSYHLNGDRETSGLVEIGLVEILQNEKGKQAVLSTMGNLFAKGYCQ